MNILEALQSLVSYPVKDKPAETILIRRGLTGSGNFDQNVANSKSFELAQADVYTYLVSATNVSEGGYAVSMTDKSNMMKLATAIYSKHGEPNPFEVNITNASDRW